MKLFFLWVFVMPLYVAIAMVVLALSLIGLDVSDSPDWAAMLTVIVGVAFFVKIHVMPLSKAKREAQIAEAERLKEEQRLRVEEQRLARQREIEDRERAVREKREAQEEARRKKASEKKRIEKENCEAVIVAMATLAEQVIVQKKKIVQEYEYEYGDILDSVKREVELLRDVRYRHPLIGTFLSTRTESDIDANVFKDLEKIFAELSE